MQSSSAANASKRPCRLRRLALPALSYMRRYLGHPSVGGRLAAGAARRSSSYTAALRSRASVPASRTVAGREIWLVGLRVHLGS